jgi:GcrA cell cycle regulator
MLANEPTWTPERIELLKNRFEAGLTCREIACDIGVSRNAVIGKLSRLNLTRDKAGNAPLASKSKPKSTATRHRREPAPKLRYHLLKALRAEPLPPSKEEQIHNGHCCSLFELSNERAASPTASPHGSAANREFLHRRHAILRGLRWRSELPLQARGQVLFGVLRRNPQVGKITLRAGVCHAFEHEEAARQIRIAHVGGVRQILPEMLNMKQPALGAGGADPLFGDCKLAHHPPKFERRAVMFQQDARRLAGVAGRVELLVLIGKPIRIDRKQDVDLVAEMPVEGLRRVTGPPRDPVRLRRVEAALLEFLPRRAHECCAGGRGIPPEADFPQFVIRRSAHFVRNSGTSRARSTCPSSPQCLICVPRLGIHI